MILKITNTETINLSQNNGIPVKTYEASYPPKKEMALKFWTVNSCEIIQR